MAKYKSPIFYFAFDFGNALPDLQSFRNIVSYLYSTTCGFVVRSETACNNPMVEKEIPK